MDEDWKIQILELPGQCAMAVHIWRRSLSGNIESMTKDGLLVVYEGQGPSEPLLKLLPEQLQAFADALNKKGYKPEKGLLEGKLERTDNHLKDMRALLKLKD